MFGWRGLEVVDIATKLALICTSALAFRMAITSIDLFRMDPLLFEVLPPELSQSP